MASNTFKCNSLAPLHFKELFGSVRQLPCGHKHAIVTIHFSSLFHEHALLAFWPPGKHDVSST